MKFPLLFVCGCTFLAACAPDDFPAAVDRSFNNTTNFIEQYRRSHARLPTREEYHSWARTNDLVGVVDYTYEHGGDTNAYTIYIWLGERLVTYSSREKTFQNRP